MLSVPFPPLYAFFPDRTWDGCEAVAVPAGRLACGYGRPRRARLGCTCSQYQVDKILGQGGTVRPRGSVADPGCLSRILFFVHPGSKNSNKRKGWKKFVLPFFCSRKYHKIKNYFIFEQGKKKLFYQFTKNYITQNIVIKLSNIWVWDPQRCLFSRHTSLLLKFG